MRAAGRGESRGIGTWRRCLAGVAATAMLAAAGGCAAPPGEPVAAPGARPSLGKSHANQEARVRAKVDEARAAIEEFGHVVMTIGAGEGEPPFAYSVGLARLNLPEILVMGLDADTMHGLVNNAVYMMRESGEPFEEGARVDGIARGYPVVFRRIGHTAAQEYLRVASVFYGDGFTAMQMVWPDAEGRMPTEPGFDQRFRPDQILLFEQAD
ncbi:DUF4262 domain-containing protein [Geminicoccaceae bacterium 1502E]|nr:DUF4262 domain-containing protein [Geminicoccaceae bacterium 1502E]